MLIDSIENGTYQLLPEITFKVVYGLTDIKRKQTVADLSQEEKLHYDSDNKGVNILLLGLPCTIKKRVKESEWFKDKMLLAQAQEVEAVMNDEQHDFLADRCDDKATENAIFKANLSPVGSINGDTVEPRYDSDILSEETLILAEESRLKLIEKQTEINAKPIDYS
nr:hypothetical protein [Tanacetum cinerariifolium]